MLATNSSSYYSSLPSTGIQGMCHAQAQEAFTRIITCLGTLSPPPQESLYSQLCRSLLASHSLFPISGLTNMAGASASGIH